MSDNPRPCQKCGKAIFIAKNDTGKFVPLDMVAPVYRLDPETGKATRDRDAHVSHFATCPEASSFSLKNAKKAGPSDG